MILTAMISVPPAVAVWRTVPHAIALPSSGSMASALAEAREAGARNRALFKRSRIPQHVGNREGRIIAVSDRWVELLGYPRERVVGHPMDELVPPGSPPTELVRGLLFRNGSISGVERRLVHADGEVLDVVLDAEVELAPEGQGTWAVVSVRDVTAQWRAEAALREAEERLWQTQRMDALGQLAGGVAHDFNNVLQTVLGSARLLRRRRDDPEQVDRLSGLITEAAERGASVSRRLLAIVRKGELRAEAVAPGDLLAWLEEVLTYTLGAGIEVRAEVPSGLPPLYADRGQLETSLVNLATNARDAMPSGGTITLSAAAETVAERGRRPAGLAPGCYLRLSVTDTGAGMDQATLARATEPFFTTKPRGAGTGLGLAMAKAEVGQ